MAPALGNLEKVRALAISGRFLAVGGMRAQERSQLSLFDHIGDKLEKQVELPAHVLALAADDAGFVAACADGKLRFVSQAGAVEREVAAHQGAVHAVALLGDLLVSAGADGVAKLWARKTGAPRAGTAELSLSSRALRAVAIEPRGAAIATGGDDGVVRVVWLADGRTRDMPGHDGPVLSLAFTPEDGRVVSGGEDGTTRLWYLEGAVEADVRGQDDTGHAGGTTAIAFLPAKDKERVGERFLTAGLDGKLRIWRTNERRKPRGLETRGAEPLYALALGAVRRQGAEGRVYCAGDARTVFGFALDAQGEPNAPRVDLTHGFDAFVADLAAPALPKRQATVAALSPLAEPEALELLLGVLSSAREPELRALVAAELAKHGRSGAKKALRDRLDDEHASVREAAFLALSTLEAATPLSPLRAALASKFADLRTRAVRALPALSASSPLVQGLVANRLTDADAPVRRAAVAALVAIHGDDTSLALRTAFERGAEDVRCEVLVRGAQAKLLGTEALTPIVGKALDDANADVRRIAFVVNVSASPALLGWLEKRDETFARALSDVVKRAAELEGTPIVAGVDDQISKVKTVGPGVVQFQHPTHGQLVIWKPNLHTPLQPGDSVRLIGIILKEQRAADYVLGSAPLPDLAQIRERLLGKAVDRDPNDAEREPLLSALACRTPDTSLRGARGLALFGDMRALGALLTISRETDPNLRREAAYALVALQDRRAMRRLAWMTSDPQAQVRDAALKCYAELEREPLALAAVALQSAWEDIRVRGLDILVKQGKGKPQAEELLRGAFDDEAAGVRSEAFRTLWSWHTADPLVPLDRALLARFADLRQRAVLELFAIAKHQEGGREEAARERLFAAISDREVTVAKAAYDGTLELRGKADTETHAAALASPLPELRVQGAKDIKAHTPQDAKAAVLDKLRSPLTKLLEDSAPHVRIAVIEALDALLKDDLGPLYVGLQSSRLDLRVRAAELLATRRDEQIIAPMQALIADKDLLARLPQLIGPLRHRAATALASLGTHRLLRYFGTELIKDEDSGLREQASRGISNACRRGEEGYLLELLGHGDIAVRSWAGEGLARLGDARGLPVLTGTLRHEHPPIRVGAIVSFAALGSEGYGGMLQGLEDPSREVQRIVLSVILAQDSRAFRAGEPPELLATALSSQRPEVRFAAARAIELRLQPERYAAHLVEVLLPERPDKAEDLEKWPDEATRARLMLGLAEALSAERAEQRYAAAQVLRLRDRPLEFFREAARAVQLRSAKAPFVPETAPAAPVPREPGKAGPLGRLRKLFASGPQGAETAAEAAEPQIAPEEQQRLRSLAFGAYVGLLRQEIVDDEAHRVRRDAIERVVELVQSGAVKTTSATPALARALDDANHLVRRAALAALLRIYAAEPERHLSLALASSAADVVRAALDELATQGAAGRARIVKALDSDVADARRYAFELLEKAAEPGSLEPLLAALGSSHADLRIGVLERLATSNDQRVVAALGQALSSDHEDLRLRAAELLASRKDDRAVDVLGACLRSDEDAVAARAREALARIGSPLAIAQLSARVDEVTTEAARVALLQALGKTRGSAALEAVAARFSDDEAVVRSAAVAAAEHIVGPRDDTKAVRGIPKPRKPDQALALRFCEAASRSRYPDVRLKAAERLDDVESTAADALAVSLFGDRNVEVRARAVFAYAVRVERRAAPVAPLADTIRTGARETMLSAAVGLAHRGGDTGVAAFRPLLLFVRAGEAGERERALLGLGTLGDPRALTELETIADGGKEDAPVDESMQAAALEALGRLFPRLKDDETKERVRDRVESSVASKVVALAVAAAKALRFIGDERSRARLEGILASGSSDAERRAAAEALGELKEAASEQALAKALNDEDDDVREAARAALDLVFPTERTRIELLAVESEHADVSEPAAAFLATEGDPSALLTKLARLESEELRSRLRFGLSRRASLPTPPLVELLLHGNVAARTDAAWIAGIGAAVLDGDRAALARALPRAVTVAGENRHDALRRGKSQQAAAEAEAQLYGVWAARRLQAPDLARVAQALVDDATAPTELRVEAARCLGASGTDTLRRALTAQQLPLRAEAASALGKAQVKLQELRTLPLDPVVLGRAAQPAKVTAPDLEQAELRRVLGPVLLSSRTLTPLLAEAQTAKAAGRLEAIAQLGLSAAPDAVALLQKLAAKGSGEPEDVRKSAYRALRRAQRRMAKEVRP